MFGWLSRRQDDRKSKVDQRVRKEAVDRVHKEYENAKLEIFVALIPAIEKQRAEFQPFADSIAAYASHAMTGEDTSAIALGPEQKAYAESLATQFSADKHLRSVAMRAAFALARYKIAQAIDSDDADFKARTGREITRTLEKPIANVGGRSDKYLAAQAQGFALCGEYAEAHDAAADALQINPNNAEGWRAMGDAFRGLGNSSEALVCYDKAKILDPEAPRLDEAIAAVSGAST